MKVKELPKAPIQIQRDELLAKVAELKKELAEKNHTIVTLESELNLKTQTITQKDNTIVTLQSELNLKSQTIIQKDNTINGLQVELNLKN